MKGRTTRIPRAAEMQTTKPKPRRKLVKKVIVAEEGSAQKLWNNYPAKRKDIVRYLGGSKMQIQELATRDWFALSEWVRLDLKSLEGHRLLELKVLIGADIHSSVRVA